MTYPQIALVDQIQVVALAHSIRIVDIYENEIDHSFTVYLKELVKGRMTELARVEVTMTNITFNWSSSSAAANIDDMERHLRVMQCCKAIQMLVAHQRGVSPY